ncbi:MAG: Rid family detoxifying hydrolase [Acidimicrobiia bacterium]
MPATPVDTPNAPPAAGPYSPAVRCGDWLVLAGQVGLDPASGKLADGIDAQARQVFANIAAVLGDCGASLRDVAKTTVYVTDLADFATINTIYGEAFAGHKPARTTIQAAGLPAGALVEIEAWAYTA